MDPLFQTSHSTTPIKSQQSEDTGVQKETLVKLKENRPVSDGILQDLSLLINDEWLAVGKFLKIPEKNLQKIHTYYGARQKEATYSMLLSWKEEMGKNAAYDILVEALKKAGRGDLADLSTELTDSQEELLVMKELLERQQRLFDLFRRGMAEKPLLPSPESYCLQQDLLLAIEENIRFQERLIDFHKHEFKMEKEIFPSFWQFYDQQQELLFTLEINLLCHERVIDIRKRRLNMVNKPFLSSSELHDLQESLILSMEFLNCQERFMEKHELELEKEPFFRSGLHDCRQRLLIMKKTLHRLKRLLDSDESDEKDCLKKYTLNFQRGLQDKLDHFIRCLKAKYTTWVKSLKSTPWMKFENLNVEDLFVEVGLLLWDPSQSTMTGSDWQPLDSYQALFTHPQLRRAHSINIQGESGSGKTILLYRMAHSWCINENLTKDVKLFILLPSRCIQGNYFTNSLYMTIKRFLLPRNTFLKESDVRDILTNTSSVLAVDDSSPDVVYRILHSPKPYSVLGHGNKVLGDLRLGKKQQVICTTSVDTNKLHTDNISNMTVKLQKWQITHHLSYLQKLLPSKEKTHDLVLKRLGENSAFVISCGNPLFYVLFIHFLKDDLVCGKEVTIENLSQLFKSTFKNLTKNTITKAMEDEKEPGPFSYPQGISKAAYESFRRNEWQTDFAAEERDYQMLEDLGILVEDQNNCFHRLHTHYMMSATGMTHRLVRFCHKIFQLWFASLYLSECSNVRAEYERLFHPKHSLHLVRPQPSTDKALLQRFICGLNSECSVILLEDLARGRYADNNDDDEHFFLCLNEYCGNDDSLQAVVNAICQRKREFNLGCGNLLVQKSMARLLNLASRWKISIECIDLRNHEIVDVNKDGLILSNDVHLERLSGKEVRINKWYGRQFTNYLKKCLQLVEIRIFANDPRKRRHEVQKEVEGMHFKVFASALGKQLQTREKREEDGGRR